MGSRVKQAGLEWVVGLVKVPAYVCDADAPYRPEALFWMDEHGVVLRSRIERPGTLIGQVAESLRELIAEHGAAPARVRVASRELAAQLTAAAPALEVVSAPTPEIDALIQLIRTQFERDAAREEAYLAGGRDPAAMAAFFAAAAALFRAAPWRSIPSEQHLLSVTIEALELRDALLAVIGRRGRNLGWALFANRSDFERYLDATDALAHGQLPAMPPHFALHFERGAALAPGSRKEVARHGWPVASADAYPWLMVMDEDLIARPPTAAEVTLAEALSRALASWKNDAPITRTLRVATHAGELSLRVRTTPTRAQHELFTPPRASG